MTAGTGHRRAAEAIAEAAQRRFPGAQIDCVNLLAYGPRRLAAAYSRIYRFLIQYLPTVWGFAYWTLDRPWIFRVIQPCRRRWNLLMARRFLHTIDSQPPDVVIATHFFPADLWAAAKRAGRLRARLIVVITDLFPHRLWLVPEADAVVVGSEETRTICSQRGVTTDRLHVLGIPVGSQFRLTADRAPLLRHLGLEPSRRTILLASGGIGVGPLIQLTKRVLALEAVRPNHAQLLVVCGENARIQRALEQLSSASSMPIRIFGFVNTMHELMQASDVMVTKAGGLTIMEAFAVALPMVFCGTIPGQEQLNAEYAARHGAGIMAHTVDEVVQTLLRVLDEPEQLRLMREHARALGRPNAARDLVEELLNPSEYEAG